MTRRTRPSKRFTTDPELLRSLIGLHAVGDRILDATYGHGGFWKGLPYQPVAIDIRDQLPGLDHGGSWRHLARLFPPSSFDVITFDPFHISDAGVGSLLGRRYAAAEDPVKGEDVSHLFRPFLEQARAVIQPETGVVIAKIADQVHSQRQRLQHVDFINTARELGWTVCECIPKGRLTVMPHNTTKTYQHLRKDCAYWILLRAGPSCVGPGVPKGYLRICQVADCPRRGKPFIAQRKDARICSDRCRQRRHRQERTDA